MQEDNLPVLSTAPIERATIFDILISHKGSLTTSEITKSLNITPHTAHRTMTELSALGLVETQDSIVEEHEEKSPPTNDNQQLEELEEKILSNSDDNLNLPTTDLNTGSEPRKLKIKFTPDYNEKEPVFWRVIGELSNDGLVEYDKLQQRLVSTVQLFVGEAVLMIEHMEKIGRIEKTERYNIYRIKH